MSAANLPVIVGAGQYVNRSREIADAVEPLEMMATVARAAEDDAGVEGLIARIDSLQVVSIIAWPYPDTTGLLAERLGARPAQRVYTAVGGDTPQRLINQTAEAIVRGETRLALICGAEVLASTRLARRLGATLPWHERGIPQEVVGDSRSGFTEVESRHGAVMPTRVYPLFENALRAHLGLSLEEHRRRLGALYERFSAVADAIQAYLPRNAATDAQLRAARIELRDRLRVATTVGYGPRYPHSTGQLHKGGPNTGVFIQLVGEDEEDLAVPGATYTFGTLKRAQALGDLESLLARKRRVTRTTLERLREVLL